MGGVDSVSYPQHLGHEKVAPCSDILAQSPSAAARGSAKELQKRKHDQLEGSFLVGQGLGRLDKVVGDGQKFHEGSRQARESRRAEPCSDLGRGGPGALRDTDMTKGCPYTLILVIACFGVKSVPHPLLLPLDNPRAGKFSWL